MVVLDRVVAVPIDIVDPAGRPASDSRLEFDGLVGQGPWGRDAPRVDSVRGVALLRPGVWRLRAGPLYKSPWRPSTWVEVEARFDAPPTERLTLQLRAPPNGELDEAGESFVLPIVVARPPEEVDGPVIVDVAARDGSWNERLSKQRGESPGTEVGFDIAVPAPGIYRIRAGHSRPWDADVTQEVQPGDVARIQLARLDPSTTLVVRFTGLGGHALEEVRTHASVMDWVSDIETVRANGEHWIRLDTFARGALASGSPSRVSASLPGEGKVFHRKSIPTEPPYEVAFDMATSNPTLRVRTANEVRFVVNATGANDQDVGAKYGGVGPATLVFPEPGRYRLTAWARVGTLAHYHPMVIHREVVEVGPGEQELRIEPPTLHTVEATVTDKTARLVLCHDCFEWCAPESSWLTRRDERACCSKRLRSNEVRREEGKCTAE